MSGLTYDPLTQTLHALKQGKDSSKANLICRFPQSQTNEGLASQSQLEEVKSKDQATHAQLKSLSTKKNERLEIESEGNPIGDPRYLPAEIVIETSAGKQIYSTDTYQDPDCLRFCPSNSTNQIEISLSGFTVKAKAASQITRTNKGFGEGVHYWEIICPISCSSLMIGVSNISNRNQPLEVIQQFRTSTPRVIGVELNLEKLTLNFWLNGRFLKERQKKVPESQIWYPTIKFKESDYFVILNPFAQGKGQTSEDSNTNCLPRTVESHIYTSYLESQLKGFIAAYGLPFNEDKEEFLKAIKTYLKLTPDVLKGVNEPIIYLPSHELLNKDSLISALIKFEKEQDAVRYYINNTDLKLLYPKQLAKLLQISDEKDKAKLGLPSYLEKPLDVSKLILDILLKQVIDESQSERFHIYSGLAQNLDIKTLSDRLNDIYEGLQEGILPEISEISSINNIQAPSNIHYINNSDKLLITNESELKLLHRYQGTFDLTQNPHFNLYPQTPNDLVRLTINGQDFKFIIEHLDWSLINEQHFNILDKLFESYQSSSSPTNFIVPYLVALQAIKILTNVAITQYETLEQTFDALQDQEILHGLSKKHMKDASASLYNNNINLNFEFGHISILDSHQLLNILLTVEDELWAKVQDDQVKSSMKDLWPQRGARIHTAYGRLSSLITFPQSLDPSSQIDPLTMADCGIVNADEKYGKLQMFQEFKVDLENIFDCQRLHRNDISAALEKQFPHNIMLKGYPSWNVPLAKTLNNFPPQVHQNSLKKKQQTQPQKIKTLKTIHNSDFILTGAEDGSINIWNSRLRLHQTCHHNFKSKLYQDEEFDKVRSQTLLKQLQGGIYGGEEEVKKDGQEVKVILKKNILPKAKLDEITEDILFTMFDEQEEAEQSEEGVNSFDSEGNEQEYEDQLDFLLDYNDSSDKTKKAAQEKKLASDKEEEKKEGEPVTTEKDKVLQELKDKLKERKKSTLVNEELVQPDADILNQMIMMGFGLEISRKALIKVKNESISAAIDAIEELNKAQTSTIPQQQKVVAKKYKYISYNCALCTFLNPEGKPTCELCNNPAPDSCKIEDKNEDDIKKEKEDQERKIKEEQEKKQKEEEEKQLKEQEEIKRKQEEELNIKRLQELKEQTREYLKNAEVFDYLFASYNQGKDFKPFLTGVVYQNKIQQRCDIHFARISYNAKYLRLFTTNSENKIACQVCNIPFLNQESCNQHLFQYHKALIESEYPIFIGNQILNQKWSLKSSRHDFTTMHADECGTVLLPLQNIDALCQIGDDITKDKPIFLLGVGMKKGDLQSQTQTVIIQKIIYSSLGDGSCANLKIETIDDDSQILRDLGITGHIKSIFYCQKSQKIILQTQQMIYILRQEKTEDKKLKLVIEDQLNMKNDEIIKKVEQGFLYVESSDKIRRFIIDESLKLSLQIQIQKDESKERLGNQIIGENEVLKMKIDPFKVTMKDLQRYERLMNGNAIGATSNADQVFSNVGEKYHQGTRYFTKHHWAINGKQEEISPLELEFQNPTSLISLNLELSFNCNNQKLVIDKLKSIEGNEVKSVPEIKGIETWQENKSESQSQEHQQILNLGLLSLQSNSNDSHNQILVKSAQKSQDYLPLVVHHHKGAAYNQTYQVSRLLVDNSQMFASNYPKPEFFLTHLHGHIMEIDKFTVKSQTNSKCGAYPCGSGLVFMSDTLSAFELTAPFHKFTLQEYQEWKQERMKDPSPLKQYEPVAYFEFDNETSITVDVDFKRPCKYILLKPVSFRKKPQHFNQNANQVPMEIEFFGVQGTSYEDQNGQSSNANGASNSLITNIYSGYDIELKILDTDQTLKILNNVQINQLQAFDIQISPQIINKYLKESKKFKIIGNTQLKMTDSHLQLQSIKGISLSIRTNNTNNDVWQLRGITIEGVSVKIDDQDQLNQSQGQIFENSEIPTSYMRSCLLSPKFYSVVNQVLASILSSEKHDYDLRISILKFFNKIMKVDREFIPLVLKEVKLEKFLQINLFDNNTSGISQVFEFLQNFQRDASFCHNLYEILIKYLESIPSNFISYHGYEAFIGMLKWSVPLNPEQTLSTLLKTLYQQICLQKVSSLQTREYINFRSRHSFNTFPFDQVVFKAPRAAQSIKTTSKKDKKKNQEAQNVLTQYKNILPVNKIIKKKYEYHHIYDVKFDVEMQVTDMKIYLGQLDQSQYKLIIKAFSEDKVVYYQTFEEHYFSQFATIPYTNIQSKISDDDALHITNLSFKGKDLKVVIEFGIGNSSMPKQNSKIKPPETLIEFYGQPIDVNLTQSKLNEMLDNKAKEFWTEKGKVFKVGKSIQMLQIVNDQTECLLIPQGTQNVQQIAASSAVQVKEDKEKVVQQIVPNTSASADEVIQINTNSAISQENQLNQSNMTELILLQEELKGKLKANDSNIKEIVEKITNIQGQLFYQQQSILDREQNKNIIPSLEYYITIATDLTKVIRSIIKSQILTKEQISQIFRDIDPEGSLSNVCFELFKRFVVFDQGHVNLTLEFIAECLYLSRIMTNEEKKQFTFRVIEEFLSNAQTTFSQKAVLEALGQLGIPEGEIISFLIKKLNIKTLLTSNQGNQNVVSKQQQQQQNKEKIQPFILMSSVLILAHNSLRSINIPAPGQFIHKGIGCSSCGSKNMIVGWRYKCGHCPGDVNLDEQCVEKHHIEHPDHILIIIQEPLPYNSKSSKAKKHTSQKPILPQFNFKEPQIIQSTEGVPDQQLVNQTHDDFNCENCGKKPIVGTCYKCANCEDYNLCHDCYHGNLYDHFSYHVFMKLHRPLKHSDKNPTILLQVLDPKLYFEDSCQKDQPVQAKFLTQKNVPINQVPEEEGDDFEDLVPLSMGRSLSVPTKKPINSQTAQKQLQTDQYEKLDCDQQFVVLFQTGVWICQDTQKSFSKEEKIVLLKLTLDTLHQLIKIASVKHIYDVISNKETFFQLLVSILQLNSKDLINLFKNLLDSVRKPPSLQIKIQEDQIKPIKPNQAASQQNIDQKQQAAAKSDKKQQLNEDMALMKVLLETMIGHVQNFLKWLIDIGLNPDIAKLQVPQGQEQWLSLIGNYQNQRVWLEHLSLILELFIKTTDELKDSTKSSGADTGIKGAVGLENIIEEANENENDEELMPLSMARSISVPVTKGQQYAPPQQQQTSNQSLSLIKSLVQLLYINDGTSSGMIPNTSPSKFVVIKQISSHFKETEPSTKYLSQMWSLVLKSLTAVSINQLIEAKIFESLVSAFLISTEEIKQITFPQILSISETIAKQAVHSNDISKFICNLLFTTLENVTDNHHEKVGYSICQGWLDILISSSVSRPPENETKNQVYAKMSAEEVSTFLKKTSHYLNNYLNKGNFEGVTGANPLIVMRLNLASDLIYVIRYSENKSKPGQLAILDLFNQCATNPKLRKEYQDSMENILAWLFLNSRQAKDDLAMSQLGNSSTLTPATQKVKQITDHLEEILLLLADSESNEIAIKIALSSMTTIVKKMNKTIIDLATNQSLGYDLSTKLSERTNSYFVKLLSSWLINDHVASYFVFDLGGFEFLLDTIGVGGHDDNGSDQQNYIIENGEGIEFEVVHGVKGGKEEERKSTESPQIEQNAFLSLAGSDLAQYLQTSIQEFQQSFQKAPISQKEEIKTEKIAPLSLVPPNVDKQTVATLQEFSKSLQMVSNNGGDPISSYQKTDWSVNKRAYKHRIIIKILTGALRSEYWMLFQLPHPVEVKEIQIAFNNYWGADTEVYAEPLSVLVEAGMDENNLSLVCNLQIVKDDAFGSVSATVFGQNLQTFQVSQSDLNSSTVEDIIQQKLQSIQNFKVQYIKFCMRRHVLTCLENSPLSIKFQKPPAFGINYISLLGYDVSKVGEFISFIKQEQKKTALEVLSTICSGDFSSILKVIANQQQTIEKMKKSFTQLASLVSLKKNLIEPTFIAISTYNTEMGDWIINQFLKSGKVYKHASLVGEIVMCNKEELPRRLKILQEYVIKQLSHIFKEEERSTHGTLIKKVLPFIEIYIQTLRITAPEIKQSQIDLEINEYQLLNIVNLLSSATQERELQTKILTQLLVLLLCPPKPFLNSSIDIFRFTVQHLMDYDEQSSLIDDSQAAGVSKAENQEIQQQRESLASILSATNKNIAREILKRGDKLQLLVNPGSCNKVSQGDKTKNSTLQHCLKFWINVAHDDQVRQQLNLTHLPLKLYHVLRQENPTENNKIIRNDSVVGEDEMLLIVELIKLLTAGDQQLEKELAESLMKDLEHLSKIRDMNFVNKVFLQLLRIETTVPVCLWPYDSDNKKWLPSYKPQIMSDQNLQIPINNNNFVPSTLLQGEKRSVFIKNFKEIVGQHSKGNIKKYLASNWALSHSQTEPPTVQQFQGFWKNVENKSPVIILLQGITQSGQAIVFGCFASKGIPTMPANFTQDQDYQVPSSPEDFMFCYVDDNNFHHFSPKTTTSILSLYTDYEGGGAISVANDFMLISFSYDFVFTVGAQYEIDKIQEKSNPKPEKEVPDQGVTMNKFEVWTLSGGSVTSQITQKAKPVASASTIAVQVQPSPQIPLAAAGVQPTLIDTSIVQAALGGLLSKQDFKHPWYNDLSPFNNYRTNPVFMVPVHLSLQQLSKIMLESNVSFKPRFNQFTQKELLSDVYQEFSQDLSIKELYNGVIDLEYDVTQLLNIAQESNTVAPVITAAASAENKEKEQSPEEQAQADSQMVQGYVPKMGLFEQFETQGGVKQIISVTLSSLRLWKAEAQAKSWELWLKELESFSEIPLFFQLFLKNTRCKDLLFKVLAGLPDTEINQVDSGKTGQDASAIAKWDEEQKVAVQFNYRILSEAFLISNDLKLREIAMQCGLLPRILERLAAISGEKPRFIEEEKEIEEVKVVEPIAEVQSSQMAQAEKNVEKKKRKGVGYSSKVGQTFNVNAYLENKKLRNDQIKNLIDICSNFINCKEWKAGEPVLDIILESALLPLLESAFRNGSWLEMAKEYEVYHSYLALTRALAGQKKLISCLVEVDKKYKPVQYDPIYRLLAKLNDLAEIFINCLNQQQKAEVLKSQPIIEKQFQQEHQKVMHLLSQSYANKSPSSSSSNSNSLELQCKSDLESQKNLKLPKHSSPNMKLKKAIDSPPFIQHHHIGGKIIEQADKTKKEYLDINALIKSKLLGKQKELKKMYTQDKDDESNEEWSDDEEKKEFTDSLIKKPFQPKTTSLSDNIMQKITKDIKDQIKEFAGLKNKMATDLYKTKHEIIQQILQKEKELEEQDIENMEDDATNTGMIPQMVQSLIPKKFPKKKKKSTIENLSMTPSEESGNDEDNSDQYETVSDASVKLEGKQQTDQNQLKQDEKEDDNDDDDDEYETISEESIEPKQNKKASQKVNKQKKPSKKTEAKQKSSMPNKSKKKQADSESSSSQNSSACNNEYGNSDDDESQEDYDSESNSDESQSESQPSNQPPKLKDIQSKKKKKANSKISESYYNESSGESKKDDDSDEEEEDEQEEDHSQSHGSSSYDTETEQTVREGESESNKNIEMDSEIPETLAREVMKTYKIVQTAVDKVLKNTRDDHFIENALNLPLAQSYRILLQDLRFDYMDMRDPNDQTNQHYKHHYQSIAQQNQNPPSSKMVRLAQELADLSNALPCEHTNSIYVRVDQQRVDMMKALICGASSTPYAHGCYEYDIFCDNNYPREPPKMNLITTGNGAVRFNPNLYACGKVCLSLLGTWRGSATENWDPKLSTILQVLLSTQAIIMSEEVYFNEPGFENEAGTPEGEKKNEGYANIVRYSNIKFAMIEQIKRPPRGFETVIKRHFYVKKPEILKEVNHWLDLADKNEATYGGLVNDHNYNWANQFKQTKTKYKEMLQAIVKQLEEELNKLERPTDFELKQQQDQKRKNQQKKTLGLKRQAITEGKAELQDIDVEDDEEEEDEDEITQINTETVKTKKKKKGEEKEIDIEDEAVKDRWSRYIGAMGVEAVAKQASANIFLSGAGALGVEISKNLVLSGCKSFTLHDYKPISYRDFSGQFFLNLEDDLLNEHNKKKKGSRADYCLPRLQQLNYYVRCKLAQSVKIPIEKGVEELEKEPWHIGSYDVIILTEASQDEIIFFDEYCRIKNKKFIAADAYGVFGRVFNDFGDKFEVLDKNGEDLQDVMIQSISNEEEGIVELLQTVKHKFEDGDEVYITKIEGMKLLPGQKHEEKEVYQDKDTDSINETIHKVKVINPYAFKIGDTRKYEKYERNGIARQLKTRKVMAFKSFKETMLKTGKELPLDPNLAVADFEKMQNNQLSHIAYEALDQFLKQYNQLPGVWNKDDAEIFVKIAKEISPRYDIDPTKDLKDDSHGLRFFYLFSFTSQGVFNPLCAFLGGFVAQECIKAITQKFTPTYQVFYYDAFEVLPEFDIPRHLQGSEQPSEQEKDIFFEEKYIKEAIKTRELNQRYDGLRIVLGQEMIDKLAHTRLFMVGAGAIGCELLKNYAMLGIGVGKPNPKKKIPGGTIVLTDPDVIETSNLSRQFLFREKHLRKPKSSTAAAAAIQMNRELKENIIARLDKVHEGTAHIFTDQFFEELTVVTNALDNVHARRYIDTRCVTAKTALLESGTLGPKGHIQVVLPFKTESYGSMNDPDDNQGGEIPHCTLKMFPEETLHCVEWARDKFGKLFTQGPKNTLKLLEEGPENFQPTSQQDSMSLKEAIKILKKRPQTFQDCIVYARNKFEKLFNHDIRQLLHVYPLDVKTKDGNLFWTLPKRPPNPMDFDENNLLHCQFVASIACLRSTIFKIEIPSKQPRSEEFKREIGMIAKQIKVPAFVPNDEKAKEIQASVNKESKGGNEEESKQSDQQQLEEEQKVDPNDVESMMKEFQKLYNDLPIKKGDNVAQKLIKPEEFEKDNDQNFHIDFIYSMANCRSSNYSLDLMDWINVKLKAGRIVPALATTTAAVAGLQTLELVKLLKNCKKVDHRNVFLNLAVPIMQASEPGDVIKTKLTEEIVVSLWDRWEFIGTKNSKLNDVIKYIEKTYKGLEVRDVLRGNTPLYFHAIMSASGKEKDKEKTLNSKVVELLGLDTSEDKYVDLTLTCVKVGDIEDKILSGVPPVRVIFE